MKRIEAWVEERKRRRAIATVRREMNLWGFPLDRFSDEEIEERFALVAQSMTGFGLTPEEASAGFVAMQRAIAEEDDPA